MKNFACCGVSCETCPNFGKSCDGCEKIAGKPFWLQYLNLDLCPVYDCCKNDKGFPNCGHCKDVPCNKIIASIDPSLSDEQKSVIATANVENLKESTRCELAKCGFLCGKCKAFKPNVRKNDERAELKRIFKKYYDLDFTVEELLCDGCNCTRPDAYRLDVNCPIRPCVIKHNAATCKDCAEFPCELFYQRKGLSENEAKALAACAYSQKEYDETLSVFNNLKNLTK